MSFATPNTPSLHKTIALPGRRKVTLVEELGRGSLATVLRGILETDAFVRRAVAVKLIDLSLTDEPDATLLALGRAAQRAAHLVHPNAVQTYEMALVEGGHAAVVMELVLGTTLDKLLQGYVDAGRRMPLDLALFVTTEIAEALSGARLATTPEGVHAGMPHLDVSLHQVLLSFHGEVKLADFGVGQAVRGGSSVRSIRAVVRGSAGLAPEIARGRPGDTRSDVFSLGILLRELLVGPRFGPEVPEAQALELTRDGVVPSTFSELQLHPGVRAILRQALEVDPGRRYPHATAMAYELRRVALSMGVGDGRVFLRNAVTELRSGPARSEPVPDAPSTVRLSGFHEDESTEELELLEMTPRLEVDRTSGLIRKAERTPSGKKTRTGEE